MKYIKIQNNGKPKYLDKKDSQLKKGWAKIKVMCCGLCGSDLTKIFFDREARLSINKHVWGHEFSGMVEKIESNCDFKAGDRVAVQPLIFDKSKEITKAKSLGKEYDGGFSEYSLVPIKNLIKIPNDLSFELACLIEPVAVCIHAKYLAEIKRDSKILVIGDGTIGILMALILKSFCSKVYLKGKNKSNLKIVSEIGIRLFKYKKNNKYNIIFETVGREQDSTLSDAIEFIMPKGKIIVLGVFSKDYVNKLILRNLFFKESSIGGSNCYGMKDFKEALRFVKNNKNKLNNIITHRFKLKDFNKALNVVKDKKNATIKIIITNK